MIFSRNDYQNIKSLGMLLSNQNEMFEGYSQIYCYFEQCTARSILVGYLKKSKTVQMENVLGVFGRVHTKLLSVDFVTVRGCPEMTSSGLTK